MFYQSVCPRRCFETFEFEAQIRNLENLQNLSTLLIESGALGALLPKSLEVMGFLMIML